MHLGSFLVVGPDFLGNPVLVMFDDGVGKLHDMLGGTVVLLQFELDRFRVVVLEIQYVLDIGPPETVDALGIVAYHADVLVSGGQFLYDEVLGIVGVLVLVHHDILESLLVFEQDFREIAEEHIGVEQQIVKVHDRSLFHPVAVLQEDTSGFRHPHPSVFFQECSVFGIVFGRNQAVFGHRDTVEHFRFLVLLGIQVEILDDFLDQRLAFVRVVDAERLLVA